METQITKAAADLEAALGEVSNKRSDLSSKKAAAEQAQAAYDAALARARKLQGEFNKLTQRLVQG